MANEQLIKVELRTPYLVLIGAEDDPTYAKTGLGIVHWRRERVAGQMRFPGCEVDLGVPDMTVSEAARCGVGSLVIGLAAFAWALKSGQFRDQQRARFLSVACI